MANDNSANSRPIQENVEIVLLNPDARPIVTAISRTHFPQYPRMETQEIHLLLPPPNAALKGYEDKSKITPATAHAAELDQRKKNGHLQKHSE